MAKTKRPLSFLLAVLMIVSMFAAVPFTASAASTTITWTQYLLNNTRKGTIVSDGITLNDDERQGNNFYSGGTTTFTAPAGKAFTQIVFKQCTWYSGGIPGATSAVDGGYYDDGDWEDYHTVTWPIDKQREVSFSAQVDNVSSIIFTLEVSTANIIWKNYDGAVLETDENVEYGTIPSYDGAEPAKTDGTCFVGWTDSSGTFYAKGTNLPAVSSGETYTATFFNKLTISNVDEWNSFAASVNGGNTYSGTILMLTADVGPVTTMVNGTFSGILDGNGHTLTVNISGGSAATFATATNAVFQSLTLAGSITGTANHTAALVKSVSAGTCTINHVDIIAEVSNSAAYIGGFIGHAGSSNTVIIENSTFSGSINKTGGEGYYIGGFIGWHTNCAVTIDNCAYTGSYSNIKSFNSVGFACSQLGTITLNNFYSNVSDKYNYTKNSSIRMYTDSYTTAAAYVQNGDETAFYTAFSDALNAWVDGSTLKLLADATDSSEIIVLPATSKTLDLNGKALTTGATITVNGTLTIQSTASGGSIKPSASKQVISVNTGATLNVNSGTINGYNADRAVIGGSGTCNLNGGKITTPASNAFSFNAGATLNLNAGEIKCTSSSTNMATSSAIYLKGDSCTINLRGTAISTNTGCGIYPKGTYANTIVNIEGGSFTATGSSLPENGGYAVSWCNVSLKGSPAINGKGIYLSNGTSINVIGTLSNIDKIGITMQTPGVFTKSVNTDYNDVSKFTSDNAKYAVRKNDSGQLSLKPVYAITWKLDADAMIDTTEVADGDVPTHAAPTKEADAQYTYTFSGWTDGENAYGLTDTLPAVTGNVTYTAMFTTSLSPTIAAVIEAIDAIGNVSYTAESKAKIDAARSAYDALTDTQKAFVTNANDLTAAEARYAELKAAAELAQVKADAKDALDAYKNADDYREAQKTELTNANRRR